MYSYQLPLMYKLGQYGPPLLLISRLNRRKLIRDRHPIGIRRRSEENATNRLYKELLTLAGAFQLDLRYNNAAPCSRHICQLTHFWFSDSNQPSTGYFLASTTPTGPIAGFPYDHYKARYGPQQFYIVKDFLHSNSPHTNSRYGLLNFYIAGTSF